MANIGDSYSEALKKVLSSLAQAATLPDADIQFNSQIQMVITQFIKQQGVDAASAIMSMGPSPNMPSGQAPQLPQGAGPGGGMPGMGLSAAMNPGPPQGAPNADELRRMLSGV